MFIGAGEKVALQSKMMGMDHRHTLNYSDKNTNTVSNTYKCVSSAVTQVRQSQSRGVSTTDNTIGFTSQQRSISTQNHSFNDAS
jgi:hypothetical protein